MNSYYYYVEVSIPFKLGETIDNVARAEFLSTGIEEFSMDEPEVDELLGERSYSGGDVPESVLNEVDEKKSSEEQKKYYFSSEEFANNFISYLDQNFQIKGRVIREEVKDWNEEWRKSYAKIIVNDEFQIIPEWEKNIDDDLDNSIYIYPGQGFGTGGHETTFLCLSLYLELAQNALNLTDCLDFGCGSGILGLSCLKRFPTASVDLYDIDKEALKNTQQNIDLNEIDNGKLKLLLPDDRDQINRKYDLVFANILQNVLLHEKKYLTHSLKKDGVLILSGLLNGQEEEVISQYKGENKALSFIKTLKKGDWVAVAFKQQ